MTDMELSAGWYLDGFRAADWTIGVWIRESGRERATYNAGLCALSIRTDKAYGGWVAGFRDGCAAGFGL